MICDQMVRMLSAVSGPSQLLLLLLILLTTSLRGVTAAYHTPTDSSIEAVITAVFMSLIVVAVLTYFYSSLKEQVP